MLRQIPCEGFQRGPLGKASCCSLYTPICASPRTVLLVWLLQFLGKEIGASGCSLPCALPLATPQGCLRGRLQRTLPSGWQKGAAQTAFLVPPSPTAAARKTPHSRYSKGISSATYSFSGTLDEGLTTHAALRLLVGTAMSKAFPLRSDLDTRKVLRDVKPLHANEQRRANAEDEQRAAGVPPRSPALAAGVPAAAAAAACGIDPHVMTSVDRFVDSLCLTEALPKKGESPLASKTPPPALWQLLQGGKLLKRLVVPGEGEDRPHLECNATLDFSLYTLHGLKLLDNHHMHAEFVEIPVANAARGVREALMTMRHNERAVLDLTLCSFYGSASRWWSIGPDVDLQKQFPTEIIPEGQSLHDVVEAKTDMLKQNIHDEMASNPSSPLWEDLEGNMTQAHKERQAEYLANLEGDQLPEDPSILGSRGFNEHRMKQTVNAGGYEEGPRMEGLSSVYGWRETESAFEVVLLVKPGIRKEHFELQITPKTFALNVLGTPVRQERLLVAWDCEKLFSDSLFTPPSHPPPAPPAPALGDKSACLGDPASRLQQCAASPVALRQWATNRFLLRSWKAHCKLLLQGCQETLESTHTLPLVMQGREDAALIQYRIHTLGSPFPVASLPLQFCVKCLKRQAVWRS
ncbi:hypothetical protein cyc_00031 [Cyclospora cayetanensis]|uniref:Uncharacterized protein n=1 Tax=Cyclospora cayetanensis TaxID=88456 RepID=A0A1D3CSG5_9EIME|nr:hypothetical protein cyc_00031 [Cyclospora cayetanensis]